MYSCFAGRLRQPVGVATAAAAINAATRTRIHRSPAAEAVGKSSSSPPHPLLRGGSRKVNNEDGTGYSAGLPPRTLDPLIETGPCGNVERLVIPDRQRHIGRAFRNGYESDGMAVFDPQPSPRWLLRSNKRKRNLRYPSPGSSATLSLQGRIFLQASESRCTESTPRIRLISVNTV